MIVSFFFDGYVYENRKMRDKEKQQMQGKF